MKTMNLQLRVDKAFSDHLTALSEVTGKSKAEIIRALVWAATADHMTVSHSEIVPVLNISRVVMTGDVEPDGQVPSYEQ